jgi:hypothetical protein
MNMQIKNALNQSAEDFRSIVWPAIAPHIGGGDLQPVESVTAEGFTKILDTLSGVDAWQVIHGQGVRAIASRAQRGFSDFGTFTIRMKTRHGSLETEFAKINRVTRLWRKGFLSAGLVVQAYLKAEPKYNKEPCAYIIHARDFYPNVRSDNKGVQVGTNSVRDGLWFERETTGGEVMAVFPVSALREAGCNVLRVPLTEAAA